jgi:hypothetical protein
MNRPLERTTMPRTHETEVSGDCDVNFDALRANVPDACSRYRGAKVEPGVAREIQDRSRMIGARRRE